MAEKLGSLFIAPNVLLEVARVAALGVPGVSRLGSHPPATVQRLLKRSASDVGIGVTIEEQAVTVDLFLVFRFDTNLLETGRQVQAEVARVITETVGLPIRAINVYIDDVESPVS